MAEGTDGVSELKLRAAGAKHPGKKRQLNEDHFAIRDDLLLYVLADGAGGHNAGEVASALAVRSISNYVGATVRSTHERPEYDRFGIPTGARRISAAVHKAHCDLLEVQEASRQHRGMGSTVVAACFSSRSGMLHLAHVGDSRCYRLRDRHFEQLTVDHSLITDVLENKPELDDTMMVRLPKNIITRALGVGSDLRVSVRSYPVVTGDRYLMCSDGLSGPVSARQLAGALRQAETPDEAVEQLVSLANAAGGPDNVSAVVIDCEGGHQVALPPGTSAAPPPPDEPRSRRASEPELLIVGMEDLPFDATDPASDEFLAAVADYFEDQDEE